MQPFAVEARGGVHVFWQQGEDLLHTTHPTSAKPAVLATQAKSGAATMLKNGEIVVAFERTSDGRNTVFARILRQL